MDKDSNEIFQDRVDELLLIEQRIERRSDQFIELMAQRQQKHDKDIELMNEKLQMLSANVVMMNNTAKTVEQNVERSTHQAQQTMKIFWWTVISCVVMTAATMLFSYYINSSLADAKSDLALTVSKLKITPTLENVQGEQYVRIVPNSETGLVSGNNKDMPGKYAKVWHAR